MDSIRVSEAPDPSSILGEATKLSAEKESGERRLSPLVFFALVWRWFLRDVKGDFRLVKQRRISSVG